MASHSSGKVLEEPDSAFAAVGFGSAKSTMLQRNSIYFLCQLLREKNQKKNGGYTT